MNQNKAKTIHQYELGPNMNYEDVSMETIEPAEDIINKPNHYHRGGIDVIGFSELQFAKEELKGFYRINCLKYLTRYDRKGGLDDLKKVSFYLDKLMGLETE